MKNEVQDRETFNRTLGKAERLRELSPEARRWVEKRIAENKQRILELTP